METDSPNKRLYIANWKSNKTRDEVAAFFENLSEGIGDVDLDRNEIIIAPPHTLLWLSRELVDKYSLPIKLGAQNVSSYPPGAYTGEVNAAQVKEVAEYVIIGHSERRKYLHETDTDIENKAREASEAGLTVVQCIQDENDKVHKGVHIVAFEPVSAIGTGNPEDPARIQEVFEKILQENPSTQVLYGGSVKPENVSQFLTIDALGGFLIGGASLEANSFLSLL